MQLDFSSFEKALNQLDEAMSYYRSDVAESDPKLRKHLRAAVIQAFEFTYELSVKTIKRHLAATILTPASVQRMTFDALIREAVAAGLLLGEVTEWRQYREEMGTARHAYDEKKAEEIFCHIPAFYEETKYLLERLRERSGVQAPRSVIDARPAHMEIVRKILKENITKNVKIWAFGSRINGRAHTYSDLDLALESVDGKRISDESISALKDAFDASDLPWKVDVLDMRAIGSEFRQIVEEHRVEVEIGNDAS